jgi:hypothetical protein
LGGPKHRHRQQLAWRHTSTRMRCDVRHFVWARGSVF